MKNLYTKIFFSLLLAIFFSGAGSAAAFTLISPTSQIIIAQPGDITTTADHISLYGACNPKEPLMLNDTALAYSRHGFFVSYQPLELGENTFLLTQKNSSKTVTVTRTAPSTDTTDDTDKFAEKDIEPTDGETWGTVTANNITRRTIPDTTLPLLTPLTKGTTCRIIGTWQGYARLADGSFVSQSNLAATAAPDDCKLFVTGYGENTAENCSQITFSLDYIPLYTVETDDTATTLTLWDVTADTVEIGYTTPVVDGIKISSNENTTTVTIPLKSKLKPSGYYMEIIDSHLVFKLKNPPHLKPQSMLSPSLKGATVFIDAGHGGDEPGALGAKGSLSPAEKNINLAIANYAAKSLAAMGANVVQSRTTDLTLPLADRVSQILDLKPDLSISVHANSLEPTADYSQSRGLQVYYSCDNSYAAAERIAERIAQIMGYEPISPFRSNLALTRTIGTPAILIETAFMSNPEDYELLTDSDFQQQMGCAIAQAASLYLLENCLS